MTAIRLAFLYADLKERMGTLRGACEAVERSRRVVDKVAGGDALYYGINTGLGCMADQRVPPEQLPQLQVNALLSHAVGVGDPLSKELCRLMLALKIQSLSLGYSGVSVETFCFLLSLWDLDLIPAVPSKGSVGASGDLAPLAHLSLPLIGKGFFWNAEGDELLPAEETLRRSGLSPIALQAKDGLALLNGTQMMSAIGAFVLERARSLKKMADVVAALSLEAWRGSLDPFSPKVQALRPHKGQSESAENVRKLCSESEQLKGKVRVQDPYSIRCISQVHGASRDALDYASQVVETEINSVTDNPLVFEDGAILSGGNFHGQPVALALDFAAIALAELASISERRSYLLLKGLNGLPPLLTCEAGLCSGCMVLQYTQAALVSENKVLCHPASVDSIPTSMGQEDHVSMGSVSALKLLEVLWNTERTLSLELLIAARAIDMRGGGSLGLGTGPVHRAFRQIAPDIQEDHDHREEMEKALEFIKEAKALTAAQSAVGELS